MKLSVSREELAAELFEKLKAQGVFWSYAKDLTYSSAKENLLIEYTLKYADFDDIKLLFVIFSATRIKAVWQNTMMADRSFIRTNFLLARLFFDMDVEADFFKGMESERAKKFRLPV